MAGGWSKDGAVQDQIDVSLEELIERSEADARFLGDTPSA